MGTPSGAPRLLVETLGREPHILRIAGEMTLADTSHLLAQLTVALHTAVQRTVIVELSDLDVPSAALLMTFPTALRQAGGWPLVALHLAAPSPSVQVMLRRLRMARYLPVHASLTDGILAARADAHTVAYAVRLPPEMESLKLARAAVRAMWPHLDAAETVANELVTNAILRANASFLLQLATKGDSAVVAVADPAPLEPLVTSVDSAPTYRGLHLVSALAQDWGVRLLAPQGKTVWAQVVA